MKKLILIISTTLALNAYSQNKMCLLIAPNTTKISIVGSGDTAITVNRVLLVKQVSFNGVDSSVSISFTPYRNLKEYRNSSSPFTATDLRLGTFYYKVPSGRIEDYDTYALQQAKQEYINNGYFVGIQ